MDDSLLYDGDGLFYSPDFPMKALDFFRSVGHTFDAMPLIIADDVLRCMYSDLNFNVYFNKNERIAFSCIESLSHLFTLSEDVFDVKQGTQIKYYAVEINTIKANRTMLAHIIHNAFAKNTMDYIIVLFRHNNKCMLSFGKNANDSILYLSDWFDNDNAMDIMMKIDISNLSIQTINGFFDDFAYMAARDYYKYPLSWEYAISKWIEAKWMENYYSSYRGDDCRDEYDFNLYDKKEFINKIVYAHLYQYGDDYIDYTYDDVYQDDPSDFDLVELEIDEIIAAEAFEMDEDNDEYEREENDSLDITERIDTENIPPEILSDPVKLLEWLKKMSD